jgi:hypothetical protein
MEPVMEPVDNADQIGEVLALSGRAQCGSCAGKMTPA